MPTEETIKCVPHLPELVLDFPASSSVATLIFYVGVGEHVANVVSISVSPVFE